MKANISLNESYEVTVAYHHVREDKVSLLALDNYISTALPSKEKFNTFRAKLENNELYVINAVAKSNDISVTIKAKNGMDISADATVKGIVDANIDVARKNNNAIELVYKTAEDRPVIFSFKAQQIIYEKESFWKNKPAHFCIKEQVGAVLLGPEDIPTKPLKTEGDLIEL
jgi:hypothetical protein